MIETTYAVQSYLDNHWRYWAGPYDSEDAARQQMNICFDSGSWKPDELRIAKIVTTEVLP